MRWAQQEKTTVAMGNRKHLEVETPGIPRSCHRMEPHAARPHPRHPLASSISCIASALTASPQRLASRFQAA
jgi:hypothetical protein